MGTLTYLAPELLEGAPVTRASDLYAVGVMAYEILAGRFPYNDTNVAVLVTEILTKPVDVRSIGVGDEMAAVLEKLLDKRREERYGDAGEVVRDLCTATGRLVPPETAEVRESYLQAASFVDRDAELGQLSRTLDTALAGHGGAWLVGGESGVGKSRLVDELRTLALIRGALTLRGQAVSEGGSPYHLWREALRWLALTTDLELKEASVLKPLVPDIGDLLGQEVPDAHPLDPEATRNRTLHVAVEVLRRGCLSGPMLVILEDLHWARSNSLALLDRLTRALSDLPLLLVGTYRDDERPRLPDELPHLRQVLKLERLTEEGIAELTESMVGAGGGEPQVLELLRRETEGNPFFLVEVVRALAEKAGRLEDIGRMSLPEKVFTGGVQQVIQRRLQRVPEGARPLLELAAVAGRELDLNVLRALAPEVELGGWLTACADSAVLEASHGRWQFAHDRLRGGALDALPEDLRPRLHRRLAEAIETVYPEADEQASALAYHWEQAQEAQTAVSYLLRAGAQARASYANEEAIGYWQRALTLLETMCSDGSSPGRQPSLPAKVYEDLGNVLRLIWRQDEAYQAYQSALVEVPQHDRVWQARLQREIGNTRPDRKERLDAYDRAAATLGKAPAKTTEWWREWVNVQLERTSTYYALAKHKEMQRLLGELQPSVEQYGTPEQRVKFSLWLDGMILRRDRYVVTWEVITYRQAALEAAQASGNLRQIAETQFRLGFALLWYGETDEAEKVLQEARGLAEQIGDVALTISCLTYLTLVYRKRGMVLQTQRHASQSLAVAAASQRPIYVAMAKANLAWVAWHRGNMTEAQEYGQAALELWKNAHVVSYPFQWAALYPLVGVALAQGRVSEAVAHSRSLLDPLQQRLPDALAGVLEQAIVAWENGNPQATRVSLDRALAVAQDLNYL